MTQPIGDIFRIVSAAQRASRSGTAYVIVSGPVRGETRVFSRDRASHNAVKTPAETVLAVADCGHTDFTGLDASEVAPVAPRATPAPLETAVRALLAYLASTSEDGYVDTGEVLTYAAAIAGALGVPFGDDAAGETTS